MESLVRRVLAGRDESAGGRVRFSDAARRAALEHVARVTAEGGSLGQAAHELGITDQTLRRWRDDETVPRLRTVQLSAEVAPRPVVVVLPGGVRIEGLDFDAVVELARRLA